MNEQEQSELYVDRGPVEEEWLEPAGWPKVIGIISIVWGVLLIGCTGCGLGMQQFAGGFMQQAFPDGMPPAAVSPSPLMYASAMFGGLVNIYLISAGSMLLLRKPAARMHHLIYGVIALVSAVIGVYIQLDVQAEITEWVKQNPDTTYSQQVGAGAMGQVFGLAAGLILGFTWPVFCLIWFGAAKRDSAEISRGADMVV
jgi:hypothetical protein